MIIERTNVMAETVTKSIKYLLSELQSNRNINWDYLRKYNGNPANQNTKGDNKKREDLYLIFFHGVCIL